MRWIEALKIWNKEHNPGKWCVARKGSPEYDQVKAIMAGGAHKKEEAKKAEAAELKAAEAPKKFVVRKVARKSDEAAAEAVKAFGGTKKEDVMRDMVHIPALEAKARMKKREAVKAFLKKALEERRAKKAAASEPKAPVKRELGFPKKEYDHLERVYHQLKTYNDPDYWKATSSKQRAELYSSLNDSRIDFSKVAEHIKRGMRIWCSKNKKIECVLDKLKAESEKAKVSEPKESTGRTPKAPEPPKEEHMSAGEHPVLMALETSIHGGNVVDRYDFLKNLAYFTKRPLPDLRSIFSGLPDEFKTDEIQPERLVTLYKRSEEEDAARAEFVRAYKTPAEKPIQNTKLSSQEPSYPVPSESEHARYHQFRFSGKFRKERQEFETKYKDFLANEAATLAKLKAEEAKSEAHRSLASEKKQLADAEADLPHAEGHRRAILEEAIAALKKSIKKREARMKRGQ